jgi:small subunit ribosomal protein S6
MGRCYTARSSCPVNALSVPERRLPAGPIETVGRKEALGSVTAYETLLILDPELPEERQTEIVTRMRELIERDGGTWATHDAWGRRRLAYEIDHKAEGTYHLVTFECDPETLDELSRILKITDGVMRHLAVRRVVGSRTSAPPPLRETGAREPDAAAVGAPEYSANTRSHEEEA